MSGSGRSTALIKDTHDVRDALQGSVCGVDGEDEAYLIAITEMFGLEVTLRAMFEGLWGHRYEIQGRQEV